MSTHVRSTQEALAAREYELKSQGTQLSGELERLRRESGQTQSLLDETRAELAGVRTALAKREKELNDIQKVWAFRIPCCSSYLLHSRFLRSICSPPLLHLSNDLPISCLKGPGV